MLSLVILIPLVILSSSPVLRSFFPELTPTAGEIDVPTASPTPSVTPDLFAFVPTATPFGAGAPGVTILATLPAPALADFAATPAGKAVSPATATPTSSPLPSAGRAAVNKPETKGNNSLTVPPVPPAPDGTPPNRLVIPALGLDAPVEPVGMEPSGVGAGVFEWAVPNHRAAGWLNTSATWGQVGNTVLAGHHNIQGEVFRGLWDLAPGDEVVLWAGGQARRYRVGDVLILPEKDQPLETRLRNAAYIQPTPDERLTLITCWPYSGNTHRVVVTALPE